MPRRKLESINLGLIVSHIWFLLSFNAVKCRSCSVSAFNSKFMKLVVFLSTIFTFQENNSGEC